MNTVEDFTNKSTLSIIVPVYNEINTISKVVDGILKTAFQKEVIIVDDGSIDGTREILSQMQHPNVSIIFHEKNTGKGGAIQTGFKHATGDIILIQDADLEYSPTDYPALLSPIFNGRADVVYGSRFSGHGAHRTQYFLNYLGNRFLTLFSNMLTNLKLTDMETGYKVFTRASLNGIEINEKRFGFEPEITAKLSQKHLRIYEVPISYRGRTYQEGKKINWRDGIWALVCIIKYNLFS
jgi:glycosyltransferase involved in cell wall biosynthesis